MSGLVIAFMLFDAGMKLVPLDVVIKATAELGYPPSAELARTLGVVALVSTALYAFPRTAVLGAILLTALWAAQSSRLTCASAIRSLAICCSACTSPFSHGAASICATAGLPRCCRCDRQQRKSPSIGRGVDRP